MAGPSAGPIERKARIDLRKLRAEFRDSAIAHAYLKLARTLDEDPPAREIASIGREMRLTYAQLLEMSGEERPDSVVDQLRKKREARDQSYGKLAE